jgi:hypothetical protein
MQFPLSAHPDFRYEVPIKTRQKKVKGVFPTGFELPNSLI